MPEIQTTLDMYIPLIMLISRMRDSLEQPQTNLMDASYTVQILYSLFSTLIIATLDINQHDLLQQNNISSLNLYYTTTCTSKYFWDKMLDWKVDPTGKLLCAKMLQIMILDG